MGFSIFAKDFSRLNIMELLLLVVDDLIVLGFLSIMENRILSTAFIKELQENTNIATYGL